MLLMADPPWLQWGKDAIAGVRPQGRGYKVLRTVPFEARRVPAAASSVTTNNGTHVHDELEVGRRSAARTKLPVTRNGKGAETLRTRILF
jgi:hypothetical protein